MNYRFRHVFMEGTPGAPGGGDPATPPASTPPSGDPATPPAEQGGAPGSALSTGAEWSIDSIPEKFRVKGADDQLDLQATIRKIDEHRSHLEKRTGLTDIRPKAPDDYKLPDGDAFKDLQLDEAGAKAFKQEAHDMGLTQKQYEAVMTKWATLAPQLVNAGQEQTVETAVTALKEHWKEGYEDNIRESYRAVNAMAEKAGIPFEEVEKAIGNNPVAIRLFAALAPELREDATPAAANGGTGPGAATADQYMAENFDAYSDPRNPKHREVTARVNQMREREAKRSPAT